MPRGSKPDPITKTKVCLKCNIEKDSGEFHADNRTPGKRKAKCKKCENERNVIWYHSLPEDKKEKRLKRIRKSLRENYEKIKWDSLKSKYGINKEDYDRMFEAQEGKCAICSISKDRLHVDHCHDTGIVRGLLCSNCNCAIGSLKHSTYRMKLAIEYIEKSQRKNDSPTKEYYESLRFFFF